MSYISAPILTYCDGQSDAANQEYLVSFQRKARDIVSFMTKGIYMVGFPNVSKMKPSMKKVMEEEIRQQAEMLRNLVMMTDNKCLMESRCFNLLSGKR